MALAWEIAASCEGITNSTSRLFPPDVRVLLYIGYILLVAAAALFYSSLQDAMTGTPAGVPVDAEQWHP